MPARKTSEPRSLRFASEHLTLSLVATFLSPFALRLQSSQGHTVQGHTVQGDERYNPPFPPLNSPFERIFGGRKCCKSWATSSFDERGISGRLVAIFSGVADPKNRLTGRFRSITFLPFRNTSWSPFSPLRKGGGGSVVVRA